MNINNNFTPLAWHKGNIELQSNLATYAFGHVVPLLADRRTLIPFQIITATGEVDITSDSTCDIALWKLSGQRATILNYRSNFGLVKKHIVVRPADAQQSITEIGYDVLIYNGTDLGVELPVGQYYLTLTSTRQGVTITWYSDVVTIVPVIATMTRITWWDEEDLRFGEGCIVYKYTSGGSSVQYKNVMYFLEEIGMPEYTVEEEGDTRDGLFYASKIVSGKKYKMQVAQLTEAMCDALRFVHLSDNVVVRDGYGRTYQCDDVLVTPNWVNGGAVASAAFEMTTDTFVKQVGKSYTE